MVNNASISLHRSSAGCQVWTLAFGGIFQVPIAGDVMMRIILPFIVLVSGLWAWSLFAGPGAGSPWAVYDQSLLLSGLLSIALMSLTMMLALRPAWLERPMGGLDQ